VFLGSHSRIAVDTNIFICHLEENPRYVVLTDLIFKWLSRKGSSGVSSTVTMTELLVQPLRRGDWAGAEVFYNLLSAYPNLRWVPPDLEVARLAAQYRAQYRLKTIDALIAATAVHASATGLITNDAALSRVEGLDVLVLESL
jgi:predicted nucleic acid-binding protein